MQVADHSTTLPTVISAVKGNILLGNTLDVLRDPLLFCRRLSQLPDDLIRCRVGSQEAIVILNADFVRQVLVENSANYTRTNTHRTFRSFLGNGLLTSEGSYWAKQRKHMQPLFHWQYLKDMADVMVEETQLRIERLRAAPQRQVNIADVITDITFQIVLRTLFGVERGAYTSELVRPLDEILHFLFRYAQQWVKPPLWAPLPSHLKYRKAVEALDVWIYDLIKERRRKPCLQVNLLDLLIDIKDSDTGEQMSDQQIRDEVMTLVMAGHDTTASALTWTVWLLATYPEEQQRLQQALSLENRTSFTYNPQQVHLRTTIQEAMRLYPPAWIFARQALKADQLGTYKIPPRSHLIVSPYILHRRPNYWSDPLSFRPSRFVEESINKSAYIPFGAGSRVCIGQRYAQMEMEIVLALLTSSITFEVVGDVCPNPFGTLKPDKGLLTKLTFY